MDGPQSATRFCRQSEHELLVHHMHLGYITDDNRRSASQLSTEGDKMKCLVLLLAVAVCQGAILRDRSFEKRQDVPEVDKQVFQKLGLPSRQLKVSTIKKPVQLLQQKVQLVQTPLTQSTKPNILGYITRFNKQPWQQLDLLTNDVFDYKNFRELMQFPGSEFLQEEIDKYIRDLPVDTELPMNEDTVKEFSNIVPMIVEKLEETVPQYTEMIQEPSTRAELITSDVIKMILRTLMQCPSTTWNKFFIQRVHNRLIRTMHQTKYQLLENFQSWLPQEMPVEREMIDQLVQEFAWDVEQKLYKDVMQYVHGIAFKDVAVVSRKLYRDLKQLFQQYLTTDPQMYMQRLISMVTDVVTDFVTCPDQQDILRKTKLACWDFQNLFLEREVNHLHSRVQNLIHKIQNKPCIGEDCTQYIWNFPNTYLQRDYHQTYKLEYPQIYKPTYPQLYKPTYPQLYKPTYPQIYKPTYSQIFPEDKTESYQQMYPEFYPRMNDVCKRTIKLYVETIMQNVPVCQNEICTDPKNCFQNFQMLEPKEMEYMQTLLKPTFTPIWTKIQQDRRL